MKFISLLVAIVIIGLLLKNQMNQRSSTAEQESISNEANRTLPDVPRAPQQVKNFEKDINTFVLDSPGQRMKNAEEALAR